MTDNAVRTITDAVVLVEYREVWFKYNGDILVGVWNEDDTGNISIDKIQKTPFNEVPFIRVKIGS